MLASLNPVAPRIVFIEVRRQGYQLFIDAFVAPDMPPGKVTPPPPFRAFGITGEVASAPLAKALARELTAIFAEEIPQTFSALAAVVEETRAKLGARVDAGERF